MTELTYLNDVAAEISPEIGENGYTIVLDIENHVGRDYVTIGYLGQDDNVMLTRAEAAHLLRYLQKVL